MRSPTRGEPHRPPHVTAQAGPELSEVADRLCHTLNRSLHFRGGTGLGLSFAFDESTTVGSGYITVIALLELRKGGSQLCRLIIIGGRFVRSGRICL